MNYLLTHGKREFVVRVVSKPHQPFMTWLVFYKGEKIDGTLHPPAPEGCSTALERHRHGGKWFFNPNAWAYNNRSSVPIQRRRKCGRPKKSK